MRQHGRVTRTVTQPKESLASATFWSSFEIKKKCVSDGRRGESYPPLKGCCFKDPQKDTKELSVNLCLPSLRQSGKSKDSSASGLARPRVTAANAFHWQRHIHKEEAWCLEKATKKEDR